MAVLILIAEDDDGLRRGLVDNLSFEGYQVLAAEDGAKALKLASENEPSLIVLDVMMPKVNGFEVCRSIRAKGLTMPILLLTARSDEQDIVLGLNLGADDYVTKPFRTREFLARVKALLRRSNVLARKSIVFGPFTLDVASHKLLKNNVPVELTPKEYSLLAYLLENRGQALSREQILSAVWGMTRFVTTRSVDRCVTTLRKKIEQDVRKPSFITTVREHGYRFES